MLVEPELSEIQSVCLSTWLVAWLFKCWFLGQNQVQAGLRSLAQKGEGAKSIKSYYTSKELLQESLVSGSGPTKLLLVVVEGCLAPFQYRLFFRSL